MIIKLTIDKIKAKIELKKVTVLVGEDVEIWFWLLLSAVKLTKENLPLRPHLFPETFKYPTAQRDVANEIGHLYNKGRWVLLATHSPYILTQLNNLLLAKSLYRESKKEEIRKKYEGIWIDPDDLVAYEVQNGQVKNIINEEGLIEARAIDAVSDEIVKETDWMLDVAYENKRR